MRASTDRLIPGPDTEVGCLYLEDLDAYPDETRQDSETTVPVQSLGAAAQNALIRSE
jgi:hypothetical protein